MLLLKEVDQLRLSRFDHQLVVVEGKHVHRKPARRLAENWVFLLSRVERHVHHSPVVLLEETHLLLQWLSLGIRQDETWTHGHESAVNVSRVEVRGEVQRLNTDALLREVLS